MLTDMSLPDNLLNAIKQTRATRGAAVVAIDGLGGAGKSTLARSLMASITDATHIQYDWFHLPRERVTSVAQFDNERLVREVLQPFRSGSKMIEFQRYNWGYLAGMEDGLEPTPTRLALGTVLVLEGCYTLNQFLDGYFDVRVWLDTAPEEALRRGIRRDIEEYELEPEQVHAAWKEWAEGEALSLARDDRRKRADFLM